MASFGIPHKLNRLLGRVCEDEGQALVEYALLISLVAVVCVVVLVCPEPFPPSIGFAVSTPMYAPSQAVTGVDPVNVHVYVAGSDAVAILR